MKCWRCQHENPTDAKFCEECASPLLRSCSNCGARLRPTAKFCAQCAHPANATAAAQQENAPPTTYTPKYLAKNILTSHAALEGERKQVTVLFADLTDSMEYELIEPGGLLPLSLRFRVFVERFRILIGSTSE